MNDFYTINVDSNYNPRDGKIYSIKHNKTKELIEEINFPLFNELISYDNYFNQDVEKKMEDFLNNIGLTNKCYNTKEEEIDLTYMSKLRNTFVRPNKEKILSELFPNSTFINIKIKFIDNDVMYRKGVTNGSGEYYQLLDRFEIKKSISFLIKVDKILSLEEMLEEVENDWIIPFIIFQKEEFKEVEIKNIQDLDSNERKEEHLIPYDSHFFTSESYANELNGLEETTPFHKKGKTNVITY